MGRVDYQVQWDSRKALVIIFIITIALSSLFLLIKVVRRENAVFTVRRCMLIVLALGSLLLALFSLVVNAQKVFDNQAALRMSCSTNILASVYEVFYFPFVYAMALLALALDLYLGQTRSFNPMPLIRFIFIAFPWLFGLLLVLPLTTAGIQWDNGCRSNFTRDRFKSHIWVCCLLPAIAVLVVALFLGFRVYRGVTSTARNMQRSGESSSSPVQYHASYNAAPQSGIIMASPTKRPESSHFAGTHYYQSNSPPPPYQTHTYPHPQYQHQHPYQPSAPSMHPHQQQHHQPYYPPPPNYAPPPPGFGPPCYEFNHALLPHQTAPPVISQPAAAPAGTTFSRDFRRETKAFFVASLVFVVCSFPYSIYNLGYSMNRDAERMEPVAEVAMDELVYWLTVCRWLLLSICWIIFMK